MNRQLDAYFGEATKWYDELNKLRSIVLGCGLTEELKWHQPGYTIDGGIVLLISSFKNYCAVAFFKGALLKDREGLLVAPGENSRSMRQARFTTVDEIAAREPVLKAYIREAIEVERAGLRVKKNPAAAVPDEFRHVLDSNPALKTAFEALTPGRRRAYLMYFAQPKQSKTREARIEKCTPQILAGKGLDDDRLASR